MTDERAEFINRVMAHRYGIKYDADGKPMLAPQERWDYGEKRKALTNELMHMSAQQLVYLRLDMELAAIVAEGYANAETYDPLGFAKH
jgi:hypothetical protein